MNSTGLRCLGGIMVIMALIFGFEAESDRREYIEARKKIQQTIESMMELRTDSLFYLLNECELHKNVSCALRVADANDNTKPTPLIIAVQYINSKGEVLVESQLRLVQGQPMEVIQTSY